ncbi:MAG: hypothetical protein ABSA53_39835 [Streptosporangiaceae bacterium]
MRRPAAGQRERLGTFHQVGLPANLPDASVSTTTYAATVAGRSSAQERKSGSCAGPFGQDAASTYRSAPPG